MDTIRRLVSEMKHTVKKADILEQFDKSTVGLSNEIIPMVEGFSSYVKNNNNKDLKEIKELNNFNRASESNSKDIKELFKFILNTLTSMSKLSNDLKSSLDDNLPDLISKDIISIKEATLINTVNLYTNIVLYTPDIILYAIGVINKSDNDIEQTFTKKKIEEIRNELANYGKALNSFNSNKNLVKDINKMTDDRVLVDGKDSNILTRLKGFNSKIKLHGFIGNPIYHVKMWFVDRELNAYEVLKEKKKLTELKILELEARKNNENDPKLEKAIAYHENKLEAIEYKIRTIES